MNLHTYKSKALFNKIEKFIEKRRLFSKDTPVIVTVSGGKDSMALAYVLAELGYRIVIAHCNFKLRGGESDGDAAFVKAYFEGTGVQVFIQEFDTSEHAQSHKTSIQIAARALRYEWFEELSRMLDIPYICTAHHKNDNAETVVFNLLHKTGISGIRGIPVSSDKIRRPLMCFSSEEIAWLIKHFDIPYREDSSNLTDKYNRNLIRQKVFPVFEKINPAFIDNIDATTQYLEQTEHIVAQYVTGLKKEYLSENDDVTTLNIAFLEGNPASETILYYILAPYGFNTTQCRSVHKCIKDRHTGRQFRSDTHQMVTATNHLYIKPFDAITADLSLIGPHQSKVYFGEYVFVFEILEKAPDFSSYDNDTIFLDYDSLSWPLQIRYKADGDYFHPLGMSGQKKSLKKHLTDLKINRLEKQRITVLALGSGEIAWVIGIRSDERFRVKDATSKILKVARSTREAK